MTKMNLNKHSIFKYLSRIYDAFEPDQLKLRGSDYTQRIKIVFKRDIPYDFNFKKIIGAVCQILSVNANHIETKLEIDERKTEGRNFSYASVQIKSKKFLDGDFFSVQATYNGHDGRKQYFELID